MRQASEASTLEHRDLLATTALKTLFATIGLSNTDGVTAEADTAKSDALVQVGALHVRASLSSHSRLDLLSCLDALMGSASVPSVHRSHPAVPSIRSIQRLYGWTESMLDVRSARQVRVERWTRRGLLAAAVLAALWGFARDKNLALHRPVMASSVCGLTPAPALGRPPLSRVVDGVEVENGLAAIMSAHGTFAVCTEMQAHPWISVDLGAPRAIRRVEVYNRADCCWGMEDIPLALQVSLDNRTFNTVATRTQPFTDDFPWRIKLSGVKARFVRLWNPADAPKNIVISELKVYGR